MYHNKLQNTKDKEKNLKSQREKTNYLKRNESCILADF